MEDDSLEWEYLGIVLQSHLLMVMTLVVCCFDETIFIRFCCMLIIWSKIASIVYENRLYASTPSTDENTYHGDG